MSDKTVIKPRPGGRGAVKSAPVEPTPVSEADNDKTRMSANVRSSEQRERLQVLSVSDNVLIDEAGALLSLVSPIRSTRQHADVATFKTQCTALITQYEQQLRHKGLASELIEQARYCMCAFIDETVLNTAWGGNSDWAQESLLSTFHNETFGGAYFFTLLDAAIAEPKTHLLLLELQYLCLSFGFVGKMRIEERGYEKLEHYRERAFKAIRSVRGEPARELSPGWRSQVVAANQLTDEFPLWVLASVVAAALLGCYMLLNYQINQYSNTVHRQLNNLISWQQDSAEQPASAKARQDAIRLQQLLQTEMRRDLLQARVQVEHLGAVGGAGDDLVVEFVLDARIGLELAHLGDVLHETELAGQLTRSIDQRGVAHQHMHDPAVRVHQAELDAQPFGVRHRAHPVFLHPLQVVGVHAVEPAEVGELLALQPEDLLQPSVHMGEQTALVDAEDADGEHAAHGGEERLVLDLGGHLFRCGEGVGGVQCRLEGQRQVGMELHLAVQRCHAHLLRVALTQVLVLGAQRAQLQLQRTLALAHLAIVVATGQARVRRRKQGAHCLNVPQGVGKAV